MLTKKTDSSSLNESRISRRFSDDIIEGGCVDWNSSPLSTSILWSSLWPLMIGDAVEKIGRFLLFSSATRLLNEDSSSTGTVILPNHSPKSLTTSIATSGPRLSDAMLSSIGRW